MGGVALSVGLLLGTVLWGYRVITRDVSGVPVVRALAGPSRVAPENPEGEIVENQGLSVNQVQAEGSAGEIAERIRLAPDPGDLRSSDLAPAAIAAADVEPVAEAVPAALTATDLAVLNIVEPDAAVAEPVAVQIISKDIPGVVMSPIPMFRPKDLVRPTQVAASTPVLNPEPVTAPVVEIAADSVPSGARLVQLGSFETADDARAAWNSISAQFADLMKGKQRIVLKGNIGATEFWRLRAAGFESREDAQRFCAVIDDGKNRICIPVASE